MLLFTETQAELLGAALLRGRNRAAASQHDLGRESAAIVGKCASAAVFLGNAPHRLNSHAVSPPAALKKTAVFKSVDIGKQEETQ